MPKRPKPSKAAAPEGNDALKAAFARIPWGSFGRQTPISRLARSVLPVGNFPSPLPPHSEGLISVAVGTAEHEAHMMEVLGTAFQVGRGKLLTCWHVCETLRVSEGCAYIQSGSTLADGKMVRISRRVIAQLSFIDPRHDAGNPAIDIGMLIVPAVSTPTHPYDVEPVAWGNSERLGVGDRVLIGGFPLGNDLFLSNATNRGLVQPSFFDGIVSAILPAIHNRETRLLQISSVALGGISGGVVCHPESGRVLGMVTSGLTLGDTSIPVTYAIPSEVLQPWSDAISFETEGGERWR